MDTRFPKNLVLLGAAALVCCAAGCDWRSPNSDVPTTRNTESSSENDVQREVDAPPQRVVRELEEGQITGPGEDGELSAQGAADLAWQAVVESAEYQPVLAVWLFDASPSAQRLVSQVSARLKEHYSSWQPRVSNDSGSSDGNEPLQSAVLLFSDQDPKFLLDAPSAAVEEVSSALDATSVVSSEVEHTFAAIRTALERYTANPNAGRNLMLFVITDEAGEDLDELDSLIPKLQRASATVYAIGSPAPMGRTDLGVAAFTMTKNSSPSGGPVIRYGPESRALELVRIEVPFRGGELAVVDSGFGPFGLESLCRASGGVFLAVRPRLVADYVGVIGDSWPSPYVKRFPREVMRHYEPEYVSAEEYQRLVESNAAAKALNQAAKFEPVSRLLGPQLEFVKRDEAQFVGDLSKAQQMAASLAPSLDRVYEVLKTGETGRAELASGRWQAAFDLALGQVCANKARVDGYNSMLARAKRGMNFQNPSSTSWLLEAADEYADSSLEKLAERGRESLERVVREHPNTPWAAVAEQELSTATGWKWTER